MNIEHKKYPETLVACVRHIVQTRAEIPPLMDQLALLIPDEQIGGAPFCVFNFITSAVEGYDIEIGFPVKEHIQSELFETKAIPGIEVLSTLHQGEPGDLGQAYARVFGFANQHAIISDEFCREIYHGSAHDNSQVVEVQFVIHNWYAKLGAGMKQVLGVEKKGNLIQACEGLNIDSSPDEHFLAVKEMLLRLDGQASEIQKYQILSPCAHVFPEHQIAKLRNVFNNCMHKSGDGLRAIDAVLDFMQADPGWSEERPVRKGLTIFSAKSPRDPQAYSAARNDLERRAAYCFCPLVRNHMDQGMPASFCYCGAGWYRQQWEGATGKPVKIDIVKSVLRGDDVCQFAIHLSEKLITHPAN